MKKILFITILFISIFFSCTEKQIDRTNCKETVEHYLKAIEDNDIAKLKELTCCLQKEYLENWGHLFQNTNKTYKSHKGLDEFNLNYSKLQKVYPDPNGSTLGRIPDLYLFNDNEIVFVRYQSDENYWLYNVDTDGVVDSLQVRIDNLLAIKYMSEEGIWYIQGEYEYECDINITYDGYLFQPDNSLGCNNEGMGYGI